MSFLFLSMLYVILAIIVSTLLTVNFKMHQRFGVDTFQAIVINYIVCLILSYFLVGDSAAIMDIPNRPWLWVSFLMGTTFIFAFNILATTIQYIGLTLTTIFQKMSMIVTLIFAFWLFSESTSTLKIIGIVLALASILLTYEKNKSEGTHHHLSAKDYLFAGSVFCMSGIIDYGFYYIKKAELVINDDMLFTGTTFGFAAVWGSIFWTYGLLTKKTKWSNKNLWAGILLGLPNVFSVYFILLSLDNGVEGTIVFPLLNIGILILSALIGFLFFSERLSQRKTFALMVAFCSIIIIGISAYV